MLTKSEIAKAVEAIRSLSDVIEKLHKATWPAASDSDVLRKINDPSASAKPLTIADYNAALADLEDLAHHVAKLGAQKDMDEQHALRKTVRYEGTRS
jgi:hypothetical protein